MRLIAHRGLMHGPNKELENTPEQIKLALASQFDVEIDLWWHKFHDVEWSWYLGHDRPEYKIDVVWLRRLNLERVWIHAKDITTLSQLRGFGWPIHYFFHENDPVTLTSSNYLWTYPGRQLTQHSIMVLPEVDGMSHIALYADYIQGICSDYVADIAKTLNR